MSRSIQIPTISIFALGLAVTAVRAAAAVAPAATPPETPAGPDFLAKNGASRGVVTTPSGLEYFVVTPGPAAGPHPGAADTVSVDYKVRLPTGQVIDSSYAS